MKKKLKNVLGGILLVVMLLSGCSNSNKEDVTEKIVSERTKEDHITEESALKEAMPETTASEVVASKAVESEEAIAEEPLQEEEVLGNPRSSYGLGSAEYLKGRNILVSLFVTTPESGWSEEEQGEILAQIKKATTYIEEQANTYQVETEFLYDFIQFTDLKVEAQTDFLINEETDFLDRLDEEIALWQEKKLSYEVLQDKYEADGIAAMIFVKNPGISYAIVYDGTDSEKETMILFAENYYQPGEKETATAYAHEILHVFGAHDLYEEAEFTAEVSEYVSRMYPDEIMYTVTQSGEKINSTLSPITAYHLGWIDEVEEVQMFPQLERE